MKAYRPPSAAKAAARPVARPQPKQRGRFRWLKRLGVVVVLLVALGFFGFWWFAYFPFEGKVDRVDALVPSEVDFVYRGSWAEIKSSGWVRKNVFDAPIHPALDPKTVIVSDPNVVPKQTLEQALDEIPAREAEINDQVPGVAKLLEGIVFGSKEFRIEKDLFPGDVVAAGRWCAGGSPREGPPKWRELLLLTRVSPLIKFVFEAAGHEFVRSRVFANRPDLDVQATPDGMLRFELKSVQPPRKRQTCEGGFEMGPTNVWWAVRVKDVLAISNSEDLASKVKLLGAGEGERAIDRPSFDSERREGTIAASVDIGGLRSYLVRMLATDQPATPSAAVSAFLGKFVAVESLDRASATVDLKDDGLVATADVKFSDSRLRDFKDVAATYELEPAPVADGLLRLIPEEDTAFVAVLRTPPRSVLGVLYDNFPKDTQKIIAGEIRGIAERRRAEGKDAYDDVPQFLDDLGKQLGTTAAIAIARIPSAFDSAKFDEWYPSNEHTPQTTLAVLIKIRDGARQEQVDEFLSDRVRTLGFDPPTHAQSPSGVEYSRMRMPASPPEYDLSEPAYIVHEGYLILATREDYLLRILAVMRGGPDAPKSVAGSPEFRTAMGSLPAAATVAVYVHGDTMRKLAWDYRNTAVRASHSEDEHEKQFRAQRIAEIGRLTPGKPINFDEEFRKRVQADVNEEMTRFRTEGYRQFIAEYRAELDQTKRIAAAGFVLAARRAEATIDLGVRLVLGP